MARRVSKMLTDKAVKAAGTGRHTDGDGLYLDVKPSGARAWLLRVVVRGRRRDFGLGAYPGVTLAKAREKADRFREMIRDGLDPVAEMARTEAQRLTFEEAAEALVESKRDGWRNAKHAKQWPSTLKTYAYPVLGPLDVRDIHVEHVLKVLTPIWKTKTETATRVRQRIEAVIDYATARKAREGENPARWRGNLDKLLPKPVDLKHEDAHHAALPWGQMADFFAKLEAREGMGALALRFTILTAARSGEVRGATWGEIDMDAGVWTIPARRMKARKEHRVPLSADALAILRTVQPLADGDAEAPVFPGGRGGRPLSDMTLSAVLRRMGRDDLTVHGFRSTFRDWAAEATPYPSELAEAALAHTIRNKVEAAYRRGDLFEKRRDLMTAWAKHCRQPAEGNVVPFDRSASA